MKFVFNGSVYQVSLNKQKKGFVLNRWAGVRDGRARGSVFSSTRIHASEAQTLMSKMPYSMTGMKALLADSLLSTEKSVSLN